jgi:hypothetical protein
MSTNNTSIKEKEICSNVLLLGMSYADFTGYVDLRNNLYNIDNVKTLVDAIVASISDQVRSGNMTEIDGRDYIRLKALEISEQCQCFTVSLVKNPAQSYNKQNHTHHDYTHRNFVPNLEKKYIHDTSHPFNEIYLDYYWMGNSKDKFTPNLWKNVIPQFGQSPILQEGGIIFIPMCILTIQWIVAMQDVYKTLFDISFLNTQDNSIQHNKLWKATNLINPETMDLVFKKEHKQEELYCVVNRSIIKQSDCINETTILDVVDYIGKHIGEHSLPHTRFICLMKKWKICSSTEVQENTLASTSRTEDPSPQEQDYLCANVCTDVVVPHSSAADKDNVKDMSYSRLQEENTIKNETVIVMPRNNNKKHDVKYGFNKNQTSLFSKHFFNDSCIREYTRLQTVSEKYDYCSNLLNSSLLNGVVIKKFNEDKEEYDILSNIQIHHHIKKVYDTRKRKIKMKMKQEKQKNATSTKCKVLSSNERLIKSVGEFDNYYHKFDMVEFENIWTEYIIHHNLYEAFDLILYNFSHLVSECYEIHHCTRTKVQIPSDGNFLLIHHGLLLYSETESKKEPNHPSSFNYAMDVRLKSYVQLDPKNSTDTKSGLERSKTQNDYTPSRRTFKLCPKFDGKDCDHCERVLYLRNTSGFQVFDVQQINDSQKMKKSRSNKKDSGPHLVCGNVEKYGWAVYTGKDVRKKDAGNIELKQDITSLIYSKSLVSYWNSYDLDHGNKGHRSKLDIMNNHEVIQLFSKEINCLNSFFDNIQEQIVMEIDGFGTASMKSKHIVFNEGKVEEGVPKKNIV